MERIPVIAGTVALSILCTLHAQDAKPKEEPVDIEARKESVATLETYIAQREKRLAEWGKDIVELDARIEKNIDELVKILMDVRDSQESGTRVSQLKKETIEGLKNALRAYQNKRREVREEVRTGEDSALGDLGKFDQRIIKRVDQIVELTKSIPTHEDVKKYESEGVTYWDGYYSENTRISEDWKQNRRDSVASKKQRDDATQALRQGIERLQQRRSSLKDLLANRDLTGSAKQLYTTELGQIDAYEDHLKSELRSLATEPGGGGRAIGRDQASDIENLISDGRRDIRDDVARLFRSYDQFAKGREYLDQLKQRLAAQKEWLDQNPAK